MTAPNQTGTPVSAACETCPVNTRGPLTRLGASVQDGDYVVALAGNPNTGKSTVFNALTGLRQHTGNWPGKTVTRAEGGFAYNGKRFRVVDLPGTYSISSHDLAEKPRALDPSPRVYSDRASADTVDSLDGPLAALVREDQSSDSSSCGRRIAALFGARIRVAV